MEEGGGAVNSEKWVHCLSDDTLLTNAGIKSPGTRNNEPAGT